jgi:hypothetical protein
VALALASCGVAEGLQPPRREGTVYVRTQEGIQVLSAATGHYTRTIPNAVASFDFEVLASTTTSDGQTTVTRVTADGDELGRALVRGELTTRVVSASGRMVALGEDEAGGSLYLPAPRARTRVVVVDGRDRAHEYDLKGNFEPEAFKVNDRELFMIEYVPALAPERYQVRRLKLASGSVVPIGRLKIAAPEQMNGTGRNQAYSPGGDELYTLYTQQGEAGHAPEEHAGADHAFVHVLNLSHSWAHCIDLPHEFSAGDATASAVAVDESGSRLYVIDWTNGAVAAINPQRLRVIRTVPIDFGSADEQTFAVATEDRLIVGGKDTIVVIDTEDMSELERWTVPGEVTGLQLDEDERLFVSTHGARVRAFELTGDELFDVEALGAHGLAHVLSD